MRAAVLDIELRQRNAPSPAVPCDFHLRAEHQQRRREIARIGRVATLPLRRDVTDVAAVFEAEAVRAAPPVALIVIDAARVEAQIAADRRKCAVTGSGDRVRGLGQSRVMRREALVARNLGDPDHAADDQSRAAVVDAIEFADAGEVDQSIDAANAASQIDQQIGPSRDIAAARMRTPGGDRLVDARGIKQTEMGQCCRHEAALRLCWRRAWRRRSTSSCTTGSGVTGSSSKSMPIPCATPFTIAGGKPASAPSLASFAPNGPNGSLLSTMASSIGGDSPIVGPAVPAAALRPGDA